jgi:hypothetical protein
MRRRAAVWAPMSAGVHERRPIISSLTLPSTRNTVHPHLGIWAFGHFGIWAFGHLGIWRRGAASSFMRFFCQIKSSPPSADRRRGRGRVVAAAGAGPPPSHHLSLPRHDGRNKPGELRERDLPVVVHVGAPASERAARKPHPPPTHRRRRWFANHSPPPPPEKSRQRDHVCCWSR